MGVVRRISSRIWTSCGSTVSGHSRGYREGGLSINFLSTSHRGVGDNKRVGRKSGRKCYAEAIVVASPVSDNKER
eukprot:806615-Prorocentrum_minimum.AAC.2